LDPIGEQWVIYNAGSTGGFALTGWTLVADIRDKDRFHRTLETVRRFAGGFLAFGGNNSTQLCRYDSDGVSIEYLELHSGAGFTIAWAQDGNHLVVALYPQIVEDALKQLRSEKNILHNPEFLAARKRVGTTGPFVYINGPEAVKNTYPLLLLFVNAISA